LVPRQQFLDGRLLNQALANFLDRSGSAPKRIGDPYISPVRPIGVGFHQDLGTPHLLTCSFELLDNIPKFTVRPDLYISCDKAVMTLGVRVVQFRFYVNCPIFASYCNSSAGTHHFRAWMPLRNTEW
jgi:hypothetical protein